MRFVGIAAGSLVGLVLLLVAVVFGVSEAGGEIVTLETRDASGETQRTRLWVVDHDGHAWLRSGQPTSSWYLRVQANPEVDVTRDGRTRSYRAEPVRDPELRDRIHALMLEKYDWAERFVAAMRDGEQSIAIRLVPRSDP